MDFDEARRVKWEAGRETYGGNGWVGKSPVEEMADEFLDEANYAEEALVRGDICEDECAWFIRRSHESWMAVQVILDRKEEEWDNESSEPRRASCGAW